MPPFSSRRERAAIASASSFLEGGSQLAILPCNSRHHRSHWLRIAADSHRPNINLFANANPGTYVNAYSYTGHWRHHRGGNRRRHRGHPHGHPGSDSDAHRNPGADGHFHSYRNP